MKRFAIVIIGATLALAGCKKKDETPATPPAGSGSAMAGSGSGSGSAAGSGSGSAAGSAAGSGSAAMAGSGSAAAAAVEVPTQEDFETEAKTKIDDKNVEAKVKAIEDDLAH